jgi:hypothetical protein
MNWAWWDGKMPVEQYEHEHGLDTEGLEAADGAGDRDSEGKSGKGDFPKAKD